MGDSNRSPRIRDSRIKRAPLMVEFRDLNGGGSGQFFQLLFLGPKLVKSQIVSFFFLEGGGLFIIFFPTLFPSPKLAKCESPKSFFEGRGKYVDQLLFLSPKLGKRQSQSCISVLRLMTTFMPCVTQARRHVHFWNIAGKQGIT